VKELNHISQAMAKGCDTQAARRRCTASNDAAPRKGRPRVHVEPEAIRALFFLPQPRAAVTLGISLTALKTLCRQNGIERWPYRRGVLVGDPVSTASGVGVDVCSDSDYEAHDAARACESPAFASEQDQARTDGPLRTSSLASSEWSQCSTACSSDRPDVSQRRPSLTASDWSRCSSFGVQEEHDSPLSCSDHGSADPDSSVSGFDELDNFDEALDLLSIKGQWVERYAREATEMFGALRVPAPAGAGTFSSAPLL